MQKKRTKKQNSVYMNITVNETTRIGIKKQMDSLLEAKRMWKNRPYLCIESILRVGLLEANVTRIPEDNIEDFLSYYNIENAKNFNVNPTYFGFDDRHHEELFFNFIFNNTKIDYDRILDTEKKAKENTDKITDKN